MCDQKKPLAIVIPAYKDTFFAQTLESIVNQTCKDFTLYIGDDASPYNLSDIVDKYKDRIDIVYKRFEENVGGKDLVAQWKRCIELTQGETWVWLFSDDDMMCPQCVESFYKEIEHAPLCDLYRFDVDIIDKESRVIGSCEAPQGVISSHDLYMLKQKGIMNSFVVEYVFSRKVYDKYKGFQNFDLAWGSDTATWLEFGYDKGIKKILDSRIQWRSSGLNITTKQDSSLLTRKLNATIDYLNWSLSFWQDKPEAKFMLQDIDKQSIKRVLASAGLLPFKDCYHAIKRYNNCSSLSILLLIILFPMYLLKYNLRK